MFIEMDKLFHAMNRFICGFKREHAKYLLEKGDEIQRKRARIYLRTKSKRIKKKQWKQIEPW